MTITSVKEVIARAVSDAGFRELLFRDPERALAGYDLTDQETTTILEGLSREGFDALAGELGERVSRAGIGLDDFVGNVIDAVSGGPDIAAEGGGVSPIPAPGQPGAGDLASLMESIPEGNLDDAMLFSGLAMAAVALMVRSAQAEASRRRAEAAELELTKAELRALRAQINPHFLFNSLNTIRYFVRTDPETARKLLLNLSEIFQRALRAGEFVALRDELSYVEAYLALEEARLGERLRVAWSIPDETCMEALVPTLILQPVVENAVVHGIAVRPESGTVSIAVECSGPEVVLRVEDDGPGIAPDKLAALLTPGEERTGIGLSNIDGRLRAIYGEVYGLAIESKPGCGTCVQMRIPCTGNEQAA
jgi:signal transduction histidine kinase